MVAPIFSGAIVVLSSDVVNLIFCITLMILFIGVPRGSCDGLEFIATGLN